VTLWANVAWNGIGLVTDPASTDGLWPVDEVRPPLGPGQAYTGGYAAERLEDVHRVRITWGVVDQPPTAVNRDAIVAKLPAALSALQDIIDTADVTLTGATAAEIRASAQANLRGLQAQVRNEARILRGLVRLAAGILDGTD
jgi:hypothetical protein